MKKLSLVALLVILSACKSEKGDAIHAQVLLPSVVATCVRFEVRDPTNDQLLETRWLTRSDDDLQIAIFRGSLPEKVELAARPYRDGDCREDAQQAPIPNGPYKTEEATFVKDDITQASLMLEPGTDGDGDGYVATGAGGADCQDAPGQAEVHPGAEEQCSDQTDRNCDDKKGCEASACGPNACEGPPTNLALTLPSSVESGTCTSAAIQVKDANGRDTRVSTATVVGLEAAPTGGIAFFSNPACNTPITGVPLAVGEGGATFFFRGQVVGDVTVNATAGQLQDTKVAHVVPGPGNRLVFTTPERNVTAGTCSMVEFQSQDAQGGAVPVTAATAVTLAASPATGFLFYSDPGCTTEVTSANIPAGMSSSSFHFRGTRAGTVTVTLTADGFAGSPQNETITAGAPTAMVFTGPQSLSAGGCSTPVTIELRDSFDNPATATGPTNINLVSSGVALTYSTNGGCSPTTTSVSITQGASTTSFRYSGTAAGTTNISGTATGLTTQTPLAVTITPGAPSVLVFTSTEQTQTAGNCSLEATVQLRDTFNNPIRVGTDTSVALSASPSTGFQFFTDSNCTGTPVTSVNIPASGSDASFYFKGTVVGTGQVAISATVTDIPAATQNVILNPGPPTVLAFSQPSVTMAAGACTEFTLLVQDTLGNASPVSGNQRITFAANPSAGFTFSANSDCSSPGPQFDVNSGESSRVLYMRGTVATDETVTASRAGFTSGTLTVKVNPGDPNKLFFLTAPQTILVGNCSGITTVQVRDTFDNPVLVSASTQINLSSDSSGGMVFYSDDTCDTPATFVTVPTGQDSARFYFRDSNAETVVITASSTNLTNATQTETIDPLPPTALVFTTNPQTVAATGCSAINTVETWAGGTPTTVTTPTRVNLSANPPTGFTFYANSTCTTVATFITIGVGQGSAIFYFKGMAPGPVTITADSNGLTSATQDETITPLPTKLLFTTPAHTTAAGICSMVVTVQPADASNNPVPVAMNTTVNLQSGPPGDPQFKFYSDASCGTQVTSVTIPARQNSANLYYKGQVVRTVTLTASVPGLTSATQDHTMVAGNAAALVFVPATPGQPLLAGTCSNLRTVETRDAFGNVATNGATVTLSGSTTAEFFQDPICTDPITGPITIAAGSSTAGFYFKGFTGGINANGTLTLTASGTGLTSATHDEAIIPTVRKGNCSFNNTSRECEITPPLLDVNKAFLTFQATSADTSSATANVRCFLRDDSHVRCERIGNGGDVTLGWSVAEFPSGVAVQPLDVACGGDTTTASFSNITMNRTFLLLSSQRNDANIAGSSTRLAELVSTTQAEIRKTGGCGGVTDNNHLQVVDFAGAEVQRGLANMASGATSTQVNLPTPVVSDRSILLYSYIADSTTTKICDRAVRGELAAGGGSVSFSRGEGDTTNCAGSAVTGISWEVVQFPAGTVVQQVTQQFAGDPIPSFVTAQISPVDMSRTVVIGGGQWASGQVHGEGLYSSSEIIGELRVQAFLVDNDTLGFYRDSANSSATFTAYVVQFKP